MSFGTPIDVNDANIINLEKQTGETIYDNRWTRLMKDELGIIVDYAGWRRASSTRRSCA